MSEAYDNPADKMWSAPRPQSVMFEDVDDPGEVGKFFSIFLPLRDWENVFVKQTLCWSIIQKSISDCCIMFLVKIFLPLRDWENVFVNQTLCWSIIQKSISDCCILFLVESPRTPTDTIP